MMYATCRNCEEVIHRELDPTGQRGEAWADDSHPITDGDDRAFQCGWGETGAHVDDWTRGYSS